MDGCRQGKLASLACAFFLAWSSTIPAWAQSPSYPNRPVTMVVPFPPGGLADTVARPVAEAMGRELGQAVVIENKPGAGRDVGARRCATHGGCGAPHWQSGMTRRP